MKKRNLVLAAAAVVTIVLSGALWFVWSGTGAAQAAMAEFQIDNLTCGSCVAKIEKTLGKVKGVESVDVSLTSNRGRVVFDQARISSAAIGQAITAAGYPARLTSELSAAEYLDLQNEQTLMSQKYVARVGDRFIKVEDFEAQVKSKLAHGKVPAEQAERVRTTTWQEVLQRELLLTAAERNNIMVQEGEVDLRVKELSGEHAGFEQLIVTSYGSMQQFRELLRQDMVINRNLEEHVFGQVTSPLERQKLFQGWYGELTKSTEVVVFDPQLKTASAKGGCGGGCCG